MVLINNTMRILVAFITLIVGLTTAQNLGGSVPACAIPCLTAATTSATTCAITDAACQCKVDNYKAIYVAALNCVLDNCGANVALCKLLNCRDVTIGAVN
jgi:hypothetical protein